jgi:tetratricopeptide (TPR) repeat protein
MVTRRIAGIICFSLIAGAFIPARAQTLILRGKVTMPDGSPPPKVVGTVRTCTDNTGTQPGPLTDKLGNFVWTMQNDKWNTRRCFIEATLNGYLSSQIEISSLDPSLSITFDLKPITLTLKGGDPYLFGEDGSEIPSKGKPEWNAAMKAATAGNASQAIEQLKAATAANPKFALAWHNLGILYEYDHRNTESRAAYTKAIEADPKLLVSYVALTRLMVQDKDWSGVTKTTAAFFPFDKSRIFAEMYAHQAAAQYNLKDLAAAEASANQALDGKSKQPFSRAEYILGRILEAMGDTAGAKQHMTRYLEIVPTVDDAALIRVHIDQMGKPDAPEPDLDVIVR